MGAHAVISNLMGLIKYQNVFLDFNIDTTIMLDFLQIILVYNLLWDGFQLYPYVLTVSHQAAILEILDVKCEKLAPGVDTVLLNKILLVTSPAHCVAANPSNPSLSPPTVI